VLQHESRIMCGGEYGQGRLSSVAAEVCVQAKELLSGALLPYSSFDVVQRVCSNLKYAFIPDPILLYKWF